MAKGHVYAVRAPGAKAVKIGRTSRSVEQRLRELNGAGREEDLELEFKIKVDDPAWVEKLAHEMLKDCRVRDDKEFFRCNRHKAIAVIKKASRMKGRCHDRQGLRGAKTSVLGRAVTTLTGMFVALFGLAVLSALGFVGFAGHEFVDQYPVHLGVAACVAALMLVSGIRALRAP
jgi:hypothetical protein